MPSHALPSRGPVARARRSSRLRGAGQEMLVFGTAWAIVSPSVTLSRGGVLDVAGHLAEKVVLFGVAGVVAGVALAAASAYARKRASTQARPRPRWQYLLFMLGYAGVAAAGFYAAVRIGHPGLTANVAGVSAMWSCGAALAMLGRAVCSGRLRRVFWWHHPPWLSGST